jgi:hypothetical protein
MDDLAVALARQVEAACEHIARVIIALTWIAIAVRPAVIIPIAVVRALTSRMAVIVTVSLMMLFDARRARFAPRRQHVLIEVPVALIAVARAYVITRIEIHDSSFPPVQSIRLSKVQFGETMNARAALGAVGWEGIDCQAITRFIVALCSSPSMLVASAPTAWRPSGIDRGCA